GAVAGVIRLLRLGDGVQIGGIGLEGQVGARAAREIHELFEQKMRAFRTPRTHDRIDGFEPLLRFDGINVFERRLLSHKCTRPHVLLRWRARYSAVALTATALSNGAIFGVWFFTVKQGIGLRFYDMPTRLPL